MAIIEPPPDPVGVAPVPGARSFNGRMAIYVSNVVQSMWFFYLCLVAIVVLHVVHPPSPSAWLLDGENDLQLLLLPVLGISQMVTQRKVDRVLEHISQMVDRVEALEERLARKEGLD